MKNNVLFLAIALLGASSLKAQLNVGSTSAADASAILQATSTTKGFLPPSMTTAQIAAIVLPAKGLTVYNNQTNQLQVNVGTTTSPSWAVGAGAANVYWSQNGSTGTTSAINYLGTTDSAALSLRTKGIERMKIDSSGHVGIGTTTIDSSALLQLSSTTKGFLTPSMTTIQRSAIILPAVGLTIFNLTTNQQEINTGTAAAPVWGSTGGTNFYAGDGSLASTRTVILNNKQLNFAGTVANLTIDSTGNYIRTNVGALKIAQVGNGNTTLNLFGGTVNLSNNDAITGVSNVIPLIQLNLQTQAAGTTSSSTKSFGLRVESRFSQVLGHAAYSIDSTELQLGNNRTPNYSLVMGDNYLMSPKNFGIGTGSDSIRSPLSIKNNSTGSKITLFDGAGGAGYLDTAHYGFGISGGRLNYDVPFGAIHAFNSNGKNGTGVVEMYINNSGVTIPRRLNMNNNLNMFIGLSAGLSTTAQGNTFLGIYSGLNNTSGANNTFTGYQSGISNTIGSSNSFYGFGAGGSNTTGYDNTFTGISSGNINTTGIRNTFMGTRTGFNNTLGNDNVFLGWQTGYNTSTGSANSYLGRDAGANGTTASNNTYSGFQSGFSTITGSSNTFSGIYAGYYITTGSYNTAIGTQAGPATGALTNTTSIGYLAQATQSNTVILGNGANVGIGTTAPAYRLDVTGDIHASGNVIAGSTTLTSDIRLKKNITPVENALNSIMKLKAVSYEKKETIAATNYNMKEIGFIAQDVRKVFPTLVSEGKDSDKTLSVNYNAIIPILTKAIQEQQAQSEKQVAEIALLKKENSSITAKLEEMKDLKIAMAAMQTELNKIAVTNKIAASNMVSK